MIDTAALNDPQVLQNELAAAWPALVTEKWAILDPKRLAANLTAVSGLTFDNFDMADWPLKAIAKINAALA
jgi:hypothetical protein